MIIWGTKTCLRVSFTLFLVTDVNPLFLPFNSDGFCHVCACDGIATWHSKQVL